jgi:hypothetical protein
LMPPEFQLGVAKNDTKLRCRPVRQSKFRHGWPAPRPGARAQECHP